MSAMVKLAREIDESASDVVGYGMVSHPITFSRVMRWRSIVSLGQPIAACQLMVCPSRRRLVTW